MARVDCTNRAEYDACLASAAFHEHWQLEQFAVRELRSAFGGLRLGGFCNVCRKPSVFAAKRRHLGSGAKGDATRLRNSLRCRGCGLLARQRLALALVDDLLERSPPGALYLAEQVSRLHTALAHRYADGSVVGSEYLGPQHQGGTLVGGVRHEDLQALSLADASVDLHVSCDVLEHVPDYEAALREAFRVLRPGGHVVFTIPFHSDLATTRRRAELRAGQLVHHLPEAFHDNPIDRRGSLVFWDHGWDVLHALAAVGFAAPTVTLMWSWTYGILGAPSQVFWARKV